MLTKQKLIDMAPGEVFAKGELYDHHEDHMSLKSCNLATTGETVRWMAVRGSGFHDRTIYSQNPYTMETDGTRERDRILAVGDKVGRHNAMKLVGPVDEEAERLYRT